MKPVHLILACATAIALPQAASALETSHLEGTTETLVKEQKPNTLSDNERAAGWKLLFDGKGLEGWHAYRQDAPPAQGWQVEDGALRVVANGGGGDLLTNGMYGDFELTFDFKVSEGANSGVIYRVTDKHGTPWQTGPEYQVLDDAAYNAGPDDIHATGGIYDLYTPSADKTTKPTGEWNTGRIRIRGGYVQHFLNGKLVAQADMTSKDWADRIAGSKFHVYEGFGVQPEGYIAFQDHGHDVWYRNIKIRDLDARMPGQVNLFKDYNEANWTTFTPDSDGSEETFHREGDVLYCTGEPKGYIRTTQGYECYILRLRWRYPEKAGNSGVMINIKDPDKIWPDCIEAQLQSGSAGDIFNIGKQSMKATDRTEGIRTPRLLDAERPVGRWNDCEIHYIADKLTIYVNGILVNAVEDVPWEEGYIGLQSEGVPVEFKDIRFSPASAF